MGFLGLTIPLGGELVVVALGVVYAVIIAVLQRKMFDRTVQDALKQHQKELNAMVKNGASKDEINAKYALMVPHMKKSMSMQLKFMIVVLPLLYIFYDFLLPALPLGPSATEKVAVNLVLFNWTFTQAGLLFIVVATLFGLALSAIVLVQDNRRLKKKEALQTTSA